MLDLTQQPLDLSASGPWKGESMIPHTSHSPPVPAAPPSSPVTPPPPPPSAVSPALTELQTVEETLETASPSLTEPLATASPTPTEIQTVDETDGFLSSLFIDCVKSAVLHLLALVIKEDRKESCHGCLIDHPSQRQHQCLDLLQDGFYKSRFYPLMKRLYGPRFVPTIQHLLRLRNIRVGDLKVRIAAETMLHELKSVKRIDYAIDEMYEAETEMSQLHALTKFWEQGKDDDDDDEIECDYPDNVVSMV